MKLPTIPKIQGIFITGTDTDVGKTWVAAGLTAALRRRGVKAVYFKPLQSGCPEEGGRLIPTDARFARDLANLPEPLELLTPITLHLPLAPGVAAAHEGVEVDLQRVAQALRNLARRYDWFVVEGAGGL
jgi:dethiobiotin synthetase